MQCAEPQVIGLMSCDSQSPTCFGVSRDLWCHHALFVKFRGSSRLERPLYISAVYKASQVRFTKPLPPKGEKKDWPSRQEGERALALVNASVVEPFPLDHGLVARLLDQRV